MQLQDSVCLVTGAARRIGREIALEFAGRGALLILHYHRSREEALELAEICSERSGRKALALAADQAQPVEIDRLVAEALEVTGRIDVLVNSASVFSRTPFLEMTLEQWNQAADVNLRGPAWFCRAAARGMVERGEGAIINIADICADNPWPGYLPYAASKAGLISLTYGLARELAPAVRVNAIGPGTVLLPEGADDALKKRAEKCSVLQRVGSPQDIAQTCVFLVEGPQFITGSFIAVDGGKRLVQGLHDTDPSG